MDNKVLREKLIDEINRLKSYFGAKKAKTLQVHRLENIVNKLVQYSDSCMECSNFLHTFEHDLLANLKSVDKHHLKFYYRNFKLMVAHLCKKHKLVTQGNHTGTYMSLGVSMGMSLGMAIGLSLDNNLMSMGMSLGICFGMSFGLLIGTLKDADAKKKGIVI